MEFGKSLLQSSIIKFISKNFFIYYFIHQQSVMKQKLIALFLFLFSTTYISAQSEITGFLGIKLEDKPYVAIEKLKKRFSNTTWEYPCIKIEKVVFLNNEFDNLIITYKDEKLTEAVFTLKRKRLAFERPLEDANSFIEKGQAAQTWVANQLTQLFNGFQSTLFSKYGNPIISSQGNTVWKDINSNSITLICTYNATQVEAVMGAQGSITITYRTSAISNDEF